MTIGAVPQVVRDFERDGKLTPREVRACELFAERLRSWDANAKAYYHRVMSQIGKHAVIIEMLFAGHMSVAEVARFILDTDNMRAAEARVLGAVQALADPGLPQR